jgi:hypothetical protein
MEVGQLVKVLVNSKIGPITAIKKDRKGKTIYVVKDFPNHENFYYDYQITEYKPEEKKNGI